MNSSPKPPRVAVIGCGYWGRNLVRNFHALGALAAVADATPAGRALAAELAPGADIVAGPERLLARADISAVALATPAITHAPLGLQVLAAGKDLFVEKPMSLDLASGQALVAAAAGAGRILQVGHLLEYHPAVDVLRRWVEPEGRLGPIRRLHGHRLNFGRVRTEEDALWSLAVHDFAVILRLVGGLPREVSCFASHLLGTPRADAAIALLRFSSGVDAHVFASWLQPTKEHKMVVVGERGMAVFDDAAPLAQKLTFYDQRIELSDGVPQLIKGAARPEPLSSDEPLRRECNAFLHSVSTRARPLTDGESALRVVAVLEACRRSMEHGGQAVAVGELPGSSTPASRFG